MEPLEWMRMTSVGLSLFAGISVKIVSLDASDGDYSGGILNSSVGVFALGLRAQSLYKKWPPLYTSPYA
jgi:hypothetical protein